MNSAFKSLAKFDAITRGLCSLADRSGWDQETMMPKVLPNRDRKK